MPELTPRDDIKKRVSEILNRVDQLIKHGDLDRALLQVNRARDLDPKNVYIVALYERILYLQEEREQNRQAEEARKRTQEEQRHKEEEARRLDEEEKRKLKEEQRKREEEQKKREKEHTQIERPETHIEPLKKYRQALLDVWVNGAATKDEELRLNDLRTSLGISQEEHTNLENEIRLEAYLIAFRRAWSSGAITPESASALTSLRKKFHIAPEEHDKIEAQLLWEIRSGHERPKLLVIDDDTNLLLLLADTLQEAGFDVRAYSTSDEAFQYISTETPDLILSDINLETSTMGGFTFYEKVRELDHLHDVPFIFLTGLTDEILIRTGKELGVDDYITKPFSDEVLIATIKGKLKRYKQLRKGRKKRE